MAWLGGLVALVASAALVALAARPGSTDPLQLRRGLLVRAFRRYRSGWVRLGLAVLGWPRLLDLALGVARAPIASTPSEAVWRSGPAVLWRYRGEPRHREPVLIVHALVSKPWILDLTPRRSLVRSLVEQGFDVWLLDWTDDPVAGDGFDACAAALLAAEQEVLRAAGAERLHLVGYCSGGTLMLARAAAFEHGHAASLAALATPVDLAAPGGMRRFLASRWLKPAMALDHRGRVPAALVRESFHALRPQALRTVWAQMRRRGSREADEAYASLAQWAWRQRPISGRLFFDMVDMYRTNSLIEGSMRLGGRAADLRRIGVPVLLALAARDHIVPGASSQALCAVPGLAVEVVTAPSGHVSMITGSSAERVLIPSLTGWLLSHQTPAPPAPEPKRRSRPAPKRSGATRARSAAR